MRVPLNRAALASGIVAIGFTLNLGPGVPVFRLVRTAYDIDGRAVEVCDTIMSAEAYVLNYELPAH